MPIYFGKEQSNPFVHKGIEGGAVVKEIQGIWTGIAAVYIPNKGIVQIIEDGENEEQALQKAKDAAIEYIDKIKQS